MKLRLIMLQTPYRKMASFNMSRLEAHVGIYRLLMKGIFDMLMYCDLLTQKVYFWISNARYYSGLYGK